jgi:hypothetical protein
MAMRPYIDMTYHPSGMKLGKAKREGYRTFRDLQFNSFAISTLFRA